MKTQYFGFLTSLREVHTFLSDDKGQTPLFSEDELRVSPRLQSHASGVLLGITQIVNGLDSPVSHTSKYAVIRIALFVELQFSLRGKRREKISSRN